ncbi:MAG: tRNA (adenosine(37)-N6)-threonylcarbamoyltransferase complex dimerization subunit type 1 TsaB [Chloroflexota bacterium]
MRTSPSADAAWILALDTATSQIVVGAGRPDGTMIGQRMAPAGFRHGELLLVEIEALMAAHALQRTALTGVVAGTGPGAFTGLRVGLATAKTLCHAMGLPIVGISTAEALLLAARRGATAKEGDDYALLLPAGPRDRVIVTDKAGPRLVPGGAPLHLPADTTLVAVDLDGRAPDEAAARGSLARVRLCSSLMELGSARLRAAEADDRDQLVPDYVTLPRGIVAARGAIEWSSDPA